MRGDDEGVTSSELLTEDAAAIDAGRFLTTSLLLLARTGDDDTASGTATSKHFTC